MALSSLTGSWCGKCVPLEGVAGACCAGVAVEVEEEEEEVVVEVVEEEEDDDRYSAPTAHPPGQPMSASPLKIWSNKFSNIIELKVCVIFRAC